MRVVPFDPTDVAEIDPPVLPIMALPNFLATYRPRGPAFTGLDENYRPLVCAGVVAEGKDEPVAWALLSSLGRARPVAVHRAVKRWVAKQTEFDVIAADARADWPRALKWCAALGFMAQSRTENFMGTGHAYVRHVWRRL